MRTSRQWLEIAVLAAVAVGGATTPAWAVFLNVGAPIDVDKRNDGTPIGWTKNWYSDDNANNKWDKGEWYGDPNPNPLDPKYKQASDQSCWAATAANLLAAAGYGNETVIYNTIVDDYKSWEQMDSVGNALRWYILGPGAGVSIYTVVTEYAADVNGKFDSLYAPDFLARELRSPDYVAMEMSPFNMGPGFIDHAVAVWGDDLPAGWGGSPPFATQCYITDSDRDFPADSPNPLVDPSDDWDWWYWQAPPYPPAPLLSYPIAPKVYPPGIGQGYYPTNMVTLGPVPEPGTVALVLVGVGALLGWSRRKRGKG